MTTVDTSTESPAAQTVLTDRTGRVIVWFLFFVSGACGLIYEVLWCRQLGLIFGNTVHSLSAVLTAFMAGLALGSFVAGRLCHRLRRPLLAYGVFELAIGLYCAVLPLLLGDSSPLIPLYRGLYGEAGGGGLAASRFAISFVLLLVPTVLMGATLPVLSQFLVRSSQKLGGTVGALYAVNTYGAVLGAATTGFILLPELGKLSTNWIAVACNLTLGLLAVYFGRVVPASLPAGAEAGGAGVPAGRHGGRPHRAVTVALITFGVTGFAAMVTQIAWTRAIALYVGSSTYAFSLTVAVFILGLGLGGTWGARLVSRLRDPVASLGQVLLFTGFLCALIIWVMSYGPVLFFYLLAWGTLQSWTWILAAQAFGIGVLILGPTFLMGATMPLTMQIASGWSASAGRTVGTVYAINTIGAILGSFCGGMVLLPLLGIQSTLEVMALCYAAPGLVLFALSSSNPFRPPLYLPLGKGEKAGETAVPSRRVRVRSVSLAALPLAGALALLLGVIEPWDPRILASGLYLLRDSDAIRDVSQGQFRGSDLYNQRRQLLYYREGASASVSICKVAGKTTLTVGGKPDASDSRRDANTMISVGLLPALLHPERPKEVLVIGFGSGLSLGALLADDGIERVDVVEMSPEVVESSVYFKHCNGLSYTADEPPTWPATPRLQVIVNDGRNHLLLSSRKYDVIANEPSNPWMAGVGNLFTREAFTLARQRLKPGGLFCQWIQAYNMSERDYLSVVRTLGEVFPHVQVWWPTDGDSFLIGSEQPITVPVARLRTRLAQRGVKEWLQRTAMERPEMFLAHFIAADETASRLSRSYPVHTDDNMLLEFSAPKGMYMRAPTVDPWRAEVVLDGLVAFDGLSDGERAEFLRKLDVAVAAKEHARFGVHGFGPRDPQLARAGALLPDEFQSGAVRMTEALERAGDIMAGRRLVRVDDPAEAVRELERFKGERLFDSEAVRVLDYARYLLARKLFEDGKTAEADAALQSVGPELAGESYVALLQARLLRAKGKLDEALHLCALAIGRGANPVEAAELNARLLLEKGDAEGALRVTQAILREPAAAGHEQTAPLWLLQAELLAQKGQLDAALENLDTVIRLQPREERFLLARGRLLLQQGKFSSALSSLRRRMLLKPADAQIARDYLNALQMMISQPDPDPRVSLADSSALMRRLAHELCATEPANPANWELLCRAFLNLERHQPKDAAFNHAQAASAFARVRELAGPEKIPADLAKLFP